MAHFFFLHSKNKTSTIPKMKMKLQFLFILAVLSTTCFFETFAQNKTLTMEDVVLSARRGLTPAKLEQLQWIPSSNSYSYIKKDNSVEEIVMADVADKSPKDVVSIQQLSQALRAKGTDTLSTTPTITWVNSERFIFNGGKRTYDYSLKNGTCSLVLDKPDENAEHEEINPSFNAMAYTVDNNLWVMTYDRRIPVTNDTNPGIVNGQIVHREEFGIHKGTYWSPSGKQLAFYRMDQTMVTDYPIMDLTKQPAGVNMIKYPMAGGKSHHVTIGIFDLASRKTIFLKTGEPEEQYLTNIAWSPDEKKIYVAILNRDQNHLKMNRYDVATGAFEATLFEEKETAYIQPLHPVTFNKDGSRFVWQSRRDGYNHLYLYDVSGKLISQLTSGKWEVTEFLGFNATNDKVYFVSTKENPINRDIYAVTVKSKDVKKISSGNGVHKALMNTSGSYVIDELSGPGNPRNIMIVNAQGKMENQLLNAVDPLKDFATVRRELFTLPTGDGDSVYCRMLKPGNFDSTRSYPVIVYVYGGPGINLITNNWTYGADIWQHFMAQRGFIVFTLENRGTPNRGKAFEQITFRQLGEVEMQDQIAGVKYLLNQRYVDKNKMGIYGWSYGGFMSVSMMTRQPGIFRVGVAGGPVIDWSHYEVMYTERYMDTPESNPEGYKKANLLNYVDKLTGKMLLIHGTSDDVVVWQHSLMYLKKAVDKNIQLDYFVYPGHEHNVTGRDRIHLLTKVSNYFFENLR